MRDELLHYYERELTFLRQMGAEFAKKYPGAASRLLLEPNRCEDPHVERMIEAFAFLAARTHLKLDDDFPEITEALLTVVYPHYLRPIPSMSVVQFQLDPEQGKLSTGLPIRRGSMLYTRPVEGYACRFQTCYDTVLWPVGVVDAQWLTLDRLRPGVRAPEAAAALRLELRCSPGVRFDQLQIDSLRFYLNGEDKLVHTLYELLCNNCTRILFRESGREARGETLSSLPPEHLRPVGFADEEAMLPYPRRSFSGYRWLQEYFAFPEKFLFLQLDGLRQLSGAGFQQNAEILFLIKPFEPADRQQMLELGVSPKTLALGCSPVVNLFPVSAEPILWDQTRFEYPVIPDVRRRQFLEVFSVDEVSITDPESRQPIDFEPFYSHRHASVRAGKPQTFWHATRRASGQPGDGTDVFLSLVDLSGRAVGPRADAISVRCTCTNRDLPSRLPFGNEDGDFELEGASSIKSIVALRKPTRSLQPRTGRASFWRLISQLSLNYLSLVDEGKESLQEILRLYNFADSPHLEKQITGIVDLKSRSHFARLNSENGASVVRGTRVEISFDEEQFVGGGVYLFANVLEHFLGLYASMNSFCQLVARSLQRKEVLGEWPPRAGETVLL